jgi:dienelactone hydrolase
MAMRLTVLVILTTFVAACGRGSNTAAPSTPTGEQAGTTSAALPSLAERTELLAYDRSAPLELVEKKTKVQQGVKVVDVAFEAAGRNVSAFLVRPQGKPRAAVLWAHWYGEATSNRSEFLPDAVALARDGVLSLLPQGLFPWQEAVSDDADADLKLAVDQVVQLRRGLDVLQREGGDVPLGFVGHDYGAMFGSALVADKRPQAYVLMAPDATFSNWFLKYFVRGARKAELDAAFAPLDPVNNVGDAAPAPVFFQFAKSDRYVPSYVADKLYEAASDPKQEKGYESGHELDAAARADRLDWLRQELGL